MRSISTRSDPYMARKSIRHPRRSAMKAGSASAGCHDAASPESRA